MSSLRRAVDDLGASRDRSTAPENRGLLGRDRLVQPLGFPKRHAGHVVARALFDAKDWLDYDVALDGRFVAIVSQKLRAEQPLAVIVSWRGR